VHSNLQYLSGLLKVGEAESETAEGRAPEGSLLPKGGAAEGEAVKNGAPEVSSLGGSAKGWSS
jgi:hypothetical protein